MPAPSAPTPEPLSSHAFPKTRHEPDTRMPSPEQRRTVQCSTVEPAATLIPMPVALVRTAAVEALLPTTH